MPSDARRLGWLRSQGLGVVCGQLTVLCLGVGSVVLAATRDTASAEVQLDDLRVFFEKPSWVHTWFYALLVVLAVYALNTALCTWDSVATKLARRVKEPAAWAPTLMHLSFLLALLAHLVGGLLGESQAPVIVGEGWSRLSDTEQARLTGLDVKTGPTGRPVSVAASLEVQAGTEVRREVIGYNAPLTSHAGTRLWLLEQAGRAPRALEVRLGGAACETPLGGRCEVGSTSIEALDLQDDLAVVRVGGEVVGLREGQRQTLRSGEVLQLVRVQTGNAVLVRGRSMPGNPWALVSALVMALGLVLMGRRWRSSSHLTE